MLIESFDISGWRSRWRLSTSTQGIPSASYATKVNMMMIMRMAMFNTAIMMLMITRITCQTAYIWKCDIFIFPPNIPPSFILFAHYDCIIYSRDIFFAYFYLEWVLKCVLKQLAYADANSHWLHLCGFVPDESSYVFSNCLPEEMQTRIGCICAIFDFNALAWTDSKLHWLHL